MTGTTTHSATTMDLDLDKVFLQQNIRRYLVRMCVNILIRRPARRRWAAALEVLRDAEIALAGVHRELDMGFLQQNIRLYLVRMYANISRDSQRTLCFARAASPAR